MSEWTERGKREERKEPRPKDQPHSQDLLTQGGIRTIPVVGKEVRPRDEKRDLLKATGRGGVGRRNWFLTVPTAFWKAAQCTWHLQHVAAPSPLLPSRPGAGVWPRKKGKGWLWSIEQDLGAPG